MESKLRFPRKMHYLHSLLDLIDCIHLNEEETTSSSRIFIKYLFLELHQCLGLQVLNERLNDE